MKKLLLSGLLGVSIAQANQANNDCSRFYLRAEAGKSFAMCGNIAANTIFWDQAAEGYQSSLGSAPLFGIGFGYIVNDWFAAGVSADYRNKFTYCKFQTLVATGTPGESSNKTRIFNLDNNSYMVDFFFNRAQKESYWSWGCNYFTVAPFIGFGLGLAINRMYNFHSVLAASVADSGFTTYPVSSIMTPNSYRSFAWQVQLGVDFVFCKDISLGLGYRYFDGGTILSNNYIASEVPGFNSPVVSPAWCGRLRANECVVSMNIQF